jgi:hypothetical protein
MVDYRTLSNFHKQKIDREIKEEIEPEHKINPYNSFEWDEPDYTLISVHMGHNCAVCWMTSHNCLCSHDD